jgi:hypothetical protein
VQTALPSLRGIDVSGFSLPAPTVAEQGSLGQTCVELPTSAAQITQTTPIPPLLSPQTAFDQANLPLDITRRDQDN